MAKTKKAKAKIKFANEDRLSKAARKMYASAKRTKEAETKSRQSKMLRRLQEINQAPVAKKMSKKAVRKSMAKKVISKLGVPGKAVVGAWTAYDIAKEIGKSKSKPKAKSKAKGKSCKPGEYLNTKGKCIKRNTVRNIPKK